MSRQATMGQKYVFVNTKYRKAIELKITKYICDYYLCFASNDRLNVGHFSRPPAIFRYCTR